jgi:polar amino acid transport system substrate-binding protein
MCLVLPKGRPAALAYVSDFVESSKKSGAVQRAIDDARLRSVRVAPAVAADAGTPITPGGGY